jgi:hypothetical protein
MSAFQFQLPQKVLVSVIIFSLSEILCSELPCDFTFDPKFGYTCRVLYHYSNLFRDAEISGVTGEHLYEGDKSNRGRSNADVFRLVFWNHQLNYLPGNITMHFRMLRTLQVKNCGLRALTRSTELNTLRRLYLGFNEIEEIPQTFFWSFCRLEILSLFDNKIVEIPKAAFRDLINLKRLSLNKNRLESIDSQLFANCINLEVVDLDNNELSAINGDLFAGAKRLRKLYMRNNRVTAIEGHFLMDLNILSVNLKNNSCIDFLYPDDGNYEVMHKIFIENCEPPPLTTTVKKSSGIPQITRKPQYKTPQIIYFEKCTWKIHEDYKHFYKSSF